MKDKTELFKAIVGLRKEIDHNLESLAKDFDITSNELLVLLDVYLYPETSLISLCERTGLKKSAVSKMIGRLEEKELLARSVCPKSKREVELNVSDGFLAKKFSWNESIKILFPHMKNYDKTLKRINALNKAVTS